MSPRDALKRMTASVIPQRVQPHVPSLSKVEEARVRLAQILDEVVTLPVDNIFSSERTNPHRSPAKALQWFPAIDAVALVLAFFCSWVAAGLTHVYLLDRIFPRLGIEGDPVSSIYFGIVSVGAVLWFLHSGHYRQRMPFWMEVQKIANTFCLAMLVHGFLEFTAKQEFSRVWLVLGWVFAALGVLILRHLARAIMRKKGVWQVRTLLVGNGQKADEARAALRSECALGYEIVMQVENPHILLSNQNGGAWQKLCDSFNADYVVIALNGEELSKADEIINDLVMSGIPFSVAPPLRHIPVLGMTPQYFFGHDLLLMAPADNVGQTFPRAIKRGIDIVGAGTALILLSPLMLLLAWLVKRDGGPAFFSDVRVGFNSSAFYCLKFRSMHMNGDELLVDYLEKQPDMKLEWKTYHKLRGVDPRVTKIGNFMRKWSIDELPQLINVLRGDMSLVGPRPIMFRERGVYSKALTHYARVRPGLTGLWQVSGRSDVSFSKRVQMDAWYVQNWSLWHDVAILCKTLPVVFNKTGAY